MKNINTINAENVTINQSITLLDAAGNTHIPEDISLHDLLALLGNVEKAETKPTPKVLRERKLEDGSVERIDPLVEAMGGDCKVFPNGYAVYTNGIGTTVLWLPDCRTFTYYFGELTDKEKDYLTQKSTVDETVFDEQPWFMAVMLRGDHQVERNAMNRTGGRMDKDKSVSLDEITEKEEVEWRPGCRFENPESAYIRKETVQEQLSKLTPEQKEAFILHYVQGFDKCEIADMLGISRAAVTYRLQGVNDRLKKDILKII